MANTNTEMLAAYQAAVARLKPSALPSPVAASGDLAAAAGEMEYVLGPAIAYARAYVAAIQAVTPGGEADAADADGLADALSDIVGALNRASNYLAEDEGEVRAERHIRSRRAA